MLYIRKSTIFLWNKQTSSSDGAQQDTEVPQIVPPSSDTLFGTIEQDDSFTVNADYTVFLFSKKVFSCETFIYINGEKSSSRSCMVLMQK